MLPTRHSNPVFRARMPLFIAALMLAACSSGGGGGNKSSSTGNDDGSDTPTSPVFTAFQEAALVLGQQNFTRNEENRGAGQPAANSMAEPYQGAWFEDDVLYLNDYYNGRILGYFGIPEENGAAADFAVGQPDLETGGDVATRSKMVGPGGFVVAGGKLLVSEWDVHRALIFGPAPTSDGANADLVLGQGGSFTSTELDFGCSATQFYHPESLWVADGKLIFADSDNARVLIWNEIPAANGTEPDQVLGQIALDDCNSGDPEPVGLTAVPGPSQRTFAYPSDIWSDGTRLVITDSVNNRVMIWNTFPAEDFTAADVVLGQVNFQDVDPGDGDSGLNQPFSVTSDGTVLIVADTGNHRVLIWNEFPTENGQAADLVLGQSDFDHVAGNDDAQTGTPTVCEVIGEDNGDATARTLCFPSSVRLIGNRLFVGDTDNHRVLIFEGTESP